MLLFGYIDSATGRFDLVGLLVSLFAILLAMTFHEFAHAWTANKLGDDTPRMMGRLTLDPFKHVDIAGLFAMLLFRFGWAKPVQINPRKFKHPRRDEILVSIAGPLSNLILAFLMVALLSLGLSVFNIELGSIYYRFVTTIFLFNVTFMIFNILPIPPLDGYHVLKNALIKKVPIQTFNTLEHYSSLILIGVVLVLYVTNVLGIVVNWVSSLLLSLVLF